MRTIVVGLGIQGNKRQVFAGSDLVTTVDPVNPNAKFKNVKDVPLDSYDSALLCTPDQVKFELIRYLLTNKKHVLVEKPLLAPTNDELNELQALAKQNGVTCYTAYNHRFEPHIVNLKKVIDSGELGEIYSARFFYGNGTARDVKLSVWRDKGTGVLPDLGSHLLDMAMFLLGDKVPSNFVPWSFNCHENNAFDHVVFGAQSKPLVMMEATLLSWRNSFYADIYAEKGSAHIDCLCKWGPSKFTVRKRVLPSGRPTETVDVLEMKDPTWAIEYDYFKELCKTGQSNLGNDIWINTILNKLAQSKS